MGLFGSNSPFDADVDKATNEKNTAEVWDVIMEICDKAGASSKNCKDCLHSIVRRMGHPDPHVALQAITLLDACVNNCGQPFRLEIASRDFEVEFRKLLQRSQPTVAMKLRQLLKKWAEGEFKTDPLLNLIPSLYLKLRFEGHDFVKKPQSDAAPVAALSKDPNVVSSQKEQDDIALAIELSLKENAAKKEASTSNGGGSSSNPYATLYSQVQANSTPSSAATSTTTAVKAGAAAAEARKVRALYDFEAAEDNELTFLAGEIIHVVDDSDPNWWKGFNQRGEGLFPSNFVTADLSVEPEGQLDGSAGAAGTSAAGAASLTNGANVTSAADMAALAAASALVDIDEERIDRLLHLLNEANPEDPSQDTNEMLRLEDQVDRMQPLIDTELERVDRKHAQLTQLSSDLVDAINLYHMLMREPIGGGVGAGAGGVGPPASAYGMYATSTTAAGQYSNAGGHMSMPMMMAGVQQQQQHMAHMPAGASRFSTMMSQPPQQQQQQQLPHPQHLPHHLLQQQQQPHSMLGLAPQHLYYQPDQQQQLLAQQQQQLHQQQLHGPPQQQQQQEPPSATAAAVAPAPPMTIQQAMLPTTLQQQQQQTHPGLSHHHQALGNQYVMSPPGGGGTVATAGLAHMPQNGMLPQQQQQQQPQHLQQPFAMNNGGVGAMPPNGSYYAPNPHFVGVQQQHQPQQSPHSIYQQQQQQQQQHPYPAVTQPITNTILPASADIPLYQQQR